MKTYKQFVQYLAEKSKEGKITFSKTLKFNITFPKDVINKGADGVEHIVFAKGQEIKGTSELMAEYYKSLGAKAEKVDDPRKR